MFEIKLKSAHMTRIGRLEDDYLSIAMEPIVEILDKCDPRRISHLFFSSFAPKELCSVDDPLDMLVTAIRARYPGFNAEVHGPYRTGGRALFGALVRAQSDPGDILVAACEKMTHVDAATSAGLLAPRVQDPVELSYGATLPALAAMVTQYYAARYRVPYAAFDAVAVKNHRNAAMNPKAHFQKAVEAEDIARSPMVCDPLRRHHCAPVSDGAAACLLSRDNAAVGFRGWGAGMDKDLFQERKDLSAFPAAARAAHTAFAMSDCAAHDVDVAEVHDAFSPFELMNIEEMGLFARGQSWRNLLNGDLDIGGSLAVNPSGGMKARGHPIGACGLTSLVEMADQLNGTAGARQHPGARVGIIQSAGGVSPDSYVFILKRLAS